MARRFTRGCRGLAALVAIGLVCCVAMPLQGGGDKEPPGKEPVIPPQAAFRGQSYGDWSADWWRWCFGQPAVGHPLSDWTGADAAKGQTGNVWFLGGFWWTNDGAPPEGVPTRTIEIPTGTALFFPVVNGENNNVEVPDATMDEIRASMAEWIESITEDQVYAYIDGKKVKDLTSYRATAYEFDMYLPEGNFLDFWGIPFEEGVIDPVAADGIFLMVPPLSVGEHTIKFGAFFDYNGDGDVDDEWEWRLDIVYIVKVVPK